MFKTAKTIDAPAAPKAKGKAKAELAVKGAEAYAMLDALTKALESAAVTIGADVRNFAAGYFSHIITATGSKPESFSAVEGIASVNVQFKKRASNQPLSDEAVQLLRQNGIEPHKEVTTRQLYAVNPKYAEDDALLAKVTAALAGIVPEDFITLQEERSKFTVTDEMLAKACSEKLPPAVVACMTSVAFKPTLKEVNIARILDFVRGLIAAPAVAEAANEKEDAQPDAARAA